ncbi:hypothetical protein 1 [Wenling toti-like virus 2]|uniref:Uncharacterized protein n=1 Tax=Wenling toti-like virus 2 TaxID=1923549 RepID=A0A1L3KF78_9VIRU|nr:hypothetical protein 1 [Wenling toti-like virus 2]APG76061.1 hypothetical protein 1 [Wenling toti-like virus 2]
MQGPSGDPFTTPSGVPPDPTRTVRWRMEDVTVSDESTPGSVNAGPTLVVPVQLPDPGKTHEASVPLPSWASRLSAYTTSTSLILTHSTSKRVRVAEGLVSLVATIIGSGQAETDIYAVTQSLSDLSKRATFLADSFSWRGTHLRVRVTRDVVSAELPLLQPRPLTRSSAQKNSESSTPDDPHYPQSEGTRRKKMHGKTHSFDPPTPPMLQLTAIIAPTPIPLPPALPTPVLLADNATRPVWVTEDYPDDSPTVPGSGDFAPTASVVLPEAAHSGITQAELLLLAGDIETNPGPRFNIITAIAHANEEIAARSAPACPDRFSAVTTLADIGDVAVEFATGKLVPVTRGEDGEAIAIRDDGTNTPVVDLSPTSSTPDTEDSYSHTDETVPGLPIDDEPDACPSDNVLDIGTLADKARDILMHRSDNVRDRPGRTYSAICSILGFPTNNRWDVLPDEADGICSASELEKASSSDTAEENGSSNSGGPKRRKPTTDGGRSDSNDGVVPRTREPARNRGTGKASPDQRDKVITRIVKTIRACPSDCYCEGAIALDRHAHDERLLAWVLKRNPRARFLGVLLDHYWGPDWRDCQPSVGLLDYSLAHLYCLCRLQHLDTSFFLISTLDLIGPPFSNELRRTLLGPAQCNEFLKKLSQHGDTLPLGNPSACGYAECQQSSQNKRMHALNGNPDFPSDMSDVDKKLQDGVKYLNSGSAQGHGPPQGHELVGLMQRMTAECGRVADSTLRYLFHLQCPTQDRAGNVRPLTDIPFPPTCVMPRRTRPAPAGALVNTANPLPVSGMKLMNVSLPKLTLSGRGEQLDAAIRENRAQVWRSISTTADGYLNSDLALLIQNLRLDGVCVESAAIRLCLLSQILSFPGPTRSIPETIYQSIDNRTYPTDTAATVGFNDSPVFGENCGGNQNFFYPYLAATGSVSFHVDARSIPFAMRQNATIIAPSWLSRYDNDESGRLLALWIMTLTEWPFCMYTVTQETTSDDAHRNNVENQLYVPSQTLFRVPGPKRIAVLLPRDTVDTKPTSNPQARRCAMIKPISGPTAVGGIPANGLLGVNSPGGQFVSYSLCRYLGSWATAWTLNDIESIIEGYKSMGLFGWELESAWEVVRGFTSWIPAMVASNNASATDFAPDQDCAARVSIPAHYELDLAGDSTRGVAHNWPQLNSPPTVCLGYMIDLQQLNLVTLGMGVGAVPHPPVGSSVASDSIGAHEGIAHQLIGSLLDASAYQILFGIAGFSCQAMRAALTDATQTDAVREFARQLHADQTTRGSLIRHAPMGKLLEGIFSHSSGFGHVGLKLSVNDDVTTIFDRLGRGYTYSSGYTNAGVRLDGMTPALFITAWLAQFSNDLPKGQCPFSRSFSSEGIQGYSPSTGSNELSDQRSDVAGVLSNCGFLDREDYVKYFSSDAAAGLNQDSDYNAKLAMTTVAAREFVGNDAVGLPPAAGTFLPAGLLLKQRPLPILAGTVRPQEDADALVGSVPKQGNLGIRILVHVVGIADSEALLKAECRQSTLQRATLVLADAVLKMPTYSRSGKKSKWGPGGGILPDFRQLASVPSQAAPGAGTPTAAVQSTQSAAAAAIH